KAWTSGTLETARIAALAAADNGAGLAAEAASWNGRPVAGSTAVALDEITLEGADLAEGVLVETVLEEVALEEGAMEAGGLGAGLASCFAGFGACLEACLGAAFADVAAVDFGLAPAGDLGVIGFGADLFLRDCLGAAMILDQLLVKVMGAPGHLGPGEMLFYAFAGVSGHRHAEFGIVKEGVGGHGQAAREFFRILGFEVFRASGGEWDQQSGFAMDHHFGNSAYVGGDHGNPAGHRFQIDDTEGFVHGWADENAGMRVQGDYFPFGKHLRNPDDGMVRVAACGLHSGFHFGADFGSVGSAGAKDHLAAGTQVA